MHKIRNNVIHLMRGEVYCIEGNTIFVMGGGYSIDKYRRTEGISWWLLEMPSKEECHNARVNLEKVGNHVDHMHPVGCVQAPSVLLQVFSVSIF